MSNRKPWVFWVLWCVFQCLASFVGARLLPRRHWIGAIVDQMPPLLAAVTATLYLRARGLSQEARHELVWLNVRRLMAEPPPVAHVEIKQAPAVKWVVSAMGAFLTIGLLWVQRHVPPDRIEGAELLLPLIVFSALATVFCWALFSRPTMRLSAQGLSGIMGPAVPWEQIASCRVHAKRNAWGDLSDPKVSVMGTHGRQIAAFDLADTPRAQRRDFLLALHRALLPHEDAPDIAPILGDQL